MSSTSEQLHRLARRIAWLDRFRRPLALVLAGIASLVILWWFTGWLPSNWPGAHMACIWFVVATFAWYAIETALGFVLALWETDYWSLTRPPSLPRAEVVRRKR